jgi:hypothetical protein
MAEERADKRRSLRGLDWINFFTADVPTRIGPFSAIYFAAARHSDPGWVWLVSLACDKAKEHGYPHELWTSSANGLASMPIMDGPTLSLVGTLVSCLLEL